MGGLGSQDRGKIIFFGEEMTELCLWDINTADDDEDKLEKKIIWYVLGEWIKGRDFLQYKLKILSVLLYQVVGMI